MGGASVVVKKARQPVNVTLRDVLGDSGQVATRLSRHAQQFRPTPPLPPSVIDGVTVPGFTVTGAIGFYGTPTQPSRGVEKLEIVAETFFAHLENFSGHPFFKGGRIQWPSKWPESSSRNFASYRVMTLCI